VVEGVVIVIRSAKLGSQSSCFAAMELSSSPESSGSQASRTLSCCMCPVYAIMTKCVVCFGRLSRVIAVALVTYIMQNLAR
jgi:hypothetical protein